MKKLTLVFAHPDDESLAVGGTAAKYVRRGWQVDLICATRGELGAEDPKDRGEELAKIREQELTKATETLGISSVTCLDYKDGKLKSLHYGEMEDKVYKLFDSLRPDVVITFDPSGMTNHPDHKKVSEATTFAFQKYAKERFSENPDDANPPKLYFTCLPQSLVAYLQKTRVIPSQRFGAPWKGISDDFITTVIDIKRQKALKVKAIMEHKSQQGPLKKLFILQNSPLLFYEHFLLRMVGTLEAFMGKNDRVSDRL